MNTVCISSHRIYHKGWDMSRFRVILVALFGFGLSFLSMAMEKKSMSSASSHYLSPDIQKLILFKSAALEDKYGNRMPEDVKNVIVQQNYDFYRDDLLASGINKKLEKALGKLNDEGRIAKYDGAKIEANDFDLLTMSDEGRDVFFHFISALPYKYTTLDGSYEYFRHDRYTSNFMRYDYDLEDESNRKHLGLLSVDDYNKMLHLPVTLRSKVGKLCAVKTIGSEVPYYSYMTKHVIKDIKREISEIIRDIPNRDRIFLTMISGASIVFALSGLGYGERFGSGVSCLSSSGYYAGSGIVCGFGGLTALLSTVIARDRHNELKRYGPGFELIDKPILTLEEQENIKKVEKEAQEKKEQRGMALYKPINTKQFEVLTKNLSKSVQSDRLSLRNKE